MLDGIYYNPTMILFGKGMENKVGEQIKKHSKKNILLHYGQKSFKKYGLYGKVIKLLKSADIEFVELGGVKPNPRASLVYKGIKLCRKHNIDFILAVGGGSVIDSAKAISIGVPWRGDFFDFFEGKQIPQKALKVATILTIPGSGSESTAGSVITHERKGLKSSYSNPIMTPVFSILNPELTYTLSEYYTACGIMDAISHILERYFTNTNYVDCSDRISESILKTLMKYAILVKKKPCNYNIRAEIMWACKLAHDNTAGFGRKQDWSSHRIAEAFGAIYDIPHAATVGVIFLAWMEYVYKTNINKFIQFSNRIFSLNINSNNRKQIVLTAINKFKKFIKSIGLPTSLQEMKIPNKKHFIKISNICVEHMQSGTIGNYVRLAPQDIVNILEMAYQ